MLGNFVDKQVLLNLFHQGRIERYVSTKWLSALESFKFLFEVLSLS